MWSPKNLLTEKYKQILRFLLSTGVSLFLLWFVFRNTDFRALGQAIRQCHIGWFSLCLLTILGSFFTRVLRWKFIVNYSESVSFRHLFTSTQIGFLANFILPGRIGEAVRAGALTKFTGIPFSRTLTYVALDRMTDLVGLIGILIFAIIGFRPTQDIQLPPEIMDIKIPAKLMTRTMYTTLIIIAGIICSLILFYRYSPTATAFFARLEPLFGKKPIQFVTRFTNNIHEAISVIQSGKSILGALFFSSLTWASFWVSHLFLFKAFALSYPWYTPPVCITCVSLLISIPGAPGFIGQFHAGVLSGLFLTIPNIDLNIAYAIAILSHGANFISVILVGLLCIYIEQFIPTPMQNEQNDYQ